MLFLKVSLVRIQIVILVLGLVSLVGCATALPEAPDSAASVPAKVADSPSEAVVVDQTLPNQIPDRQALAEFQVHLNDGSILETTIPVVVAETGQPGQIADRQALAEYQSQIIDSNPTSMNGHMIENNEALPNQIADRQALAEYQFLISSGAQAR